MRISGARLVMVLPVTVGLLLAGCGGGSSGAEPASPPVGTVGVAPGKASGVTTFTNTAVGEPTDDATDDPTDDATASDDATEPGPVQGGTVNPDDPTGVAQAYGVTLVDPQAEGMVEFGFVGFRSPSGRIVCGVSDEDGGTHASARCDVVDNTWTPPARPSDCDLDWGGSVGVEADGRKAHFTCVGDVASDGKGVLAYGKAVLVGPILCMSRTTGVECVVTSGPKHGFRVARSAYSLY